MNAKNLQRVARFELPGEGWQFLAQTDALVLLSRGSGPLEELVLVDVSGEPQIKARRVGGASWYTGRIAVIAGQRVFISGLSGMTKFP